MSNGKSSAGNVSSTGYVWDIVTVGMMSALVFLGTYLFKIPAPFGYTHLGDCMIILAVCLFGTKKGALAGAIGAGLSDLLGGYAVWVLPTAIIKASWALIMGLVAYKLLAKFKYGYVVGAIAGGIVHIILYTAVKVPLYGLGYAIVRVPVLSAQTVCGIIIGSVLYFVFEKIPAVRKLSARNK